jgi:ketosteroid isomerase-like protein
VAELKILIATALDLREDSGVAMRFPHWLATVCFWIVAAAGPALAQPSSGAFLEIRSYNLKPGLRDEFHRRFVAESLPLLQQRKIDVVWFGPSAHDQDSYVLMRAFPSLAERDRQEDAFYSSGEWQQGPRAAVLAAIDTYTTVLIHVDEDTLGGLRGMHNTGGPSDLSELLRLNTDYVTSVQASDVRRFEQILAPDFWCTLADGSFVDRAQFLERTARPSNLRELQAHDVQVRIMGDLAIVHARTSFITADGSEGRGRYTDIWARRGGAWLAVAAHVTRH